MKIFLKTVVVAGLVAFSLVAVAADQRQGRVEGATPEGRLEPARAPAIDEGGTDELMKVLTQKVAEKKSVVSKDLLSDKEDTTESVPWAKTFVSFLFVTTLMVVGAWFVNRHLKGDSSFKGFGALKGLGNFKLSNLTRPQGSIIRVLQNLTLGLKNQVVVMEVEGTKIVVGLSGSQMLLLHILPSITSYSERRAAGSGLPPEGQPVVKPEDRPAAELAVEETAPVIAAKPLVAATLPPQEFQIPEVKPDLIPSGAPASTLSDKIRKVVTVLKPFPNSFSLTSERLDSSDSSSRADASVDLMEKGFKKRQAASSRRTGFEKNV